MASQSGKTDKASKRSQKFEPGTGIAERLAHASSRRPRLRLGTRLRNYFLTGLIIVGPLTITLYIVWWGINVIDAWVKPLVPDRYLPDTYLPFAVPGAGLVFAIFGIAIIGALAANLFGRTLISYGELVLGRMPVVRNVYAGLKQIFQTVLSESSSSFQKVGLIEYPRAGLYSIVFISTDARGEIAARWQGETRLISVFLPTTPNPTSGYLLFVPEADVTELDMSVEEAAKLVISAGLVTPPYDASWVAEMKAGNDDAAPDHTARDHATTAAASTTDGPTPSEATVASGVDTGARPRPAPGEPARPLRGTTKPEAAE